jgi:hypothetical protein
MIGEAPRRTTLHEQGSPVVIHLSPVAQQQGNSTDKQRRVLQVTNNSDSETKGTAPLAKVRAVHFCIKMSEDDFTRAQNASLMCSPLLKLTATPEVSTLAARNTPSAAASTPAPGVSPFYVSPTFVIDTRYVLKDRDALITRYPPMALASSDLWR